jgi:hypothetical protein
MKESWICASVQVVFHAFPAELEILSFRRAIVPFSFRRRARDEVIRWLSRRARSYCETNEQSILNAMIFGYIRKYLFVKRLLDYHLTPGPSPPERGVSPGMRSVCNVTHNRKTESQSNHQSQITNHQIPAGFLVYVRMARLFNTTLCNSIRFSPY